MLNKPFKVLIGADATWSASIVDGQDLFVSGGTGFGSYASGQEVLVVDKFFRILTPGSTVADSDIIYVGQATAETYVVTGPTGVSGTLYKIRWSDPIEGNLVTGFRGKAYAAKSEQVTTFTCTNLVVTAGTELVLRITYKDMQDQKGGGQFVHSYHYTCVSGETVDTAADNLMDLVNDHQGARVIATVSAGSDYLILTGKPIPSCTTGLTDIDEFVMVSFDAFLNYIDSDGYSQKSLATQTTTVASTGNGTWELVRDAEKAGLGYHGFTNQTTFPILKPTTQVTKSETYDQVIIEHKKSYIAPDNLYTKATPLKTIIFIPNTASANQMDSVLARLNPWMASTPGSFKPVSF
jgi:hypothetical protein